MQNVWTEMKLFIAIESSQSQLPQYRDRRSNCRIWAAREYPDVQYRFFVGGESESEVGDKVTLFCPDSYDDLAVKTQKMMEYCYANFQFDMLFKCDDDTFVHLPRLIERVREAYKAKQHYVGNTPGPIPS